MKMINKKQSIIFGFLVLLVFSSEAENNKSFRQIFHFATKKESIKFLTTEDAFTKHWSKFDINSRLGRENGTKKELMQNIADQAKSWSPEEKNKINNALLLLEENIAKQGFRLNLPSSIPLVKTTGKEEGGAAGYTRSNYIVLKEDLISMKNKELAHLIVHELFHILTRQNQSFRENMYNIIGFKIFNEITYPDSLKDFRITNPDAPIVDSYINLKKDGNTVKTAMILFAKDHYSNGNFLEYLQVGFLNIHDNQTIYNFKEIDNFFGQVGRNTRYIIHPEEILAENFAFAVLNKRDLPSPSIVNEIKVRLQRKE